MPLYAFKCPACGRMQDFLVGMNEIAGIEPNCSKCGQKMRRVFTTFAIHGFEYPNSVNYEDTEESYGEEEQKKEIRQMMKKIEGDGRINELSKEDQKYYEEYCKA